ncbi:MAG: HAMP domain-containing sensor histidine kinase [Pseudomonadota bacterium]
MRQAGRGRSYQVALRLSLSLFVVFSGVFFFQQFRESRQRIDQKLQIDADFLVKALKVGDIIFITQYLSAFADSGVVSGAGIQDSEGNWIRVLPATMRKEAFLGRSIKFGFSQFEFRGVYQIGSGSDQWQIHYIYHLTTLIFLYAILLSMAAGLIVFWFTDRMLKQTVDYFAEPMMNLSGDLDQQMGHVGSDFLDDSYQKGQKFEETDRFVGELKKLVSEINRQNDKLKEAQIHEAISKMSRQVNHDIQSPLGALRAASQNLQSNPDAASSLILRSIQRISDIVSDLKFKEEPSEELFSEVKPVEINEFVESLVNEKRAEYQTQNVAIHFEPIVTNALVEIDQNQVSRALSNIINNGIEAVSGSTPLIQIAIDLDASWVSVAVKDNGSGVSEELRKKVFEYGYSSKNSRNSGTGLSQAVDVISQHGGKITLESDEAGLYRIFKVQFARK